MLRSKGINSMQKVQLLLNFSKEYFMDHTFESLNENVILSLKEEVEEVSKICQSEFNVFLANLQIPEFQRKKYLRLNMEFRGHLAIFKPYLQVSLKQQKRKHFRSISGDDEELDASYKINFRKLKLLFLELEIQYQFWVEAEAKRNNQDLLPSDSDEHLAIPIELKKPFFDELFDHFLKLNKLVNYKCLEKLGENIDSQIKIEGIKSSLEEFQKDEPLKFLWHKIRDTDKIIKILGHIVNLSCSLYGDKIVDGSRPPAQRKESNFSDKIQSMNPNQNSKPLSSSRFSTGFSKIRSKKSFKELDSIIDELKNVFEDDTDENLYFEDDKNKFIDNIIQKNVPSESVRPKQATESIPRKSLNHFEGRCHCQVF